ncbi:hypothetical protein K0M31_010543 [Melipona bicolor]|uniref:Uncharacterized protein n=1 Tax=Melipona bicolor TaxID=60889 RepID=A0AA40KI92_9HYME|nr:hypothetical protein K0M31_010543 [Melipona bicolor]
MSEQLSFRQIISDREESVRVTHRPLDREDFRVALPSSKVARIGRSAGYGHADESVDGVCRRNIAYERESRDATLISKIIPSYLGVTNAVLQVLPTLNDLTKFHVSRERRDINKKVLNTVNEYSRRLVTSGWSDIVLDLADQGTVFVKDKGQQPRTRLSAHQETGLGIGQFEDTINSPPWLGSSLYASRRTTR